mgnify:CR=1 FL=1
MAGLSGFAAVFTSGFPEFCVGVDQVGFFFGQPNTTAFVQFVDSRGITYRFDARNATSNLQCRERQRYIGRINTGILEEIEDQCATSGRVVSLKINGTF